MSTIRTAPILAAAYKGRDVSGRPLLTHSILVDAAGDVERVLCGRVLIDSICDAGSWTDETPTCKTCAAKLARQAA
jgi:hypothetical protein